MCWPDLDGRDHELQRDQPDFPDLEISLFGPDSESGTYDYFNEEILGEDEAGEMIEPAAATSRARTTTSWSKASPAPRAGSATSVLAYYEAARTA